MKENTTILNKLAIQKADKYLNSVKDLEKFSEAPELSTSPFIPKLISQFVMQRKTLHSERVMSGLDIVNQKTGEIISGADENRVFATKELVDKEKFIKVYFDGVANMFDLSKTAIRIFGYIIEEMADPRNINRDCIYIGIQDTMDYCGYKVKNMIYQGLTELIVAGFIARASRPPSHYYINPKIVFNGNRIVTMKEYIKKKDNEIPLELHLSKSDNNDWPEE